MYSVDTSALIDAANKYYARDIAPGFWVAFERLVAEQKIQASEYVIIEMERKSDELKVWCRQHKSDIESVATNEIQVEYQRLLARYPNFGVGGALKNGADPWVVATAKINHLTVITHEKQTNNMNGPKIPDVCKAERIPFVSIWDLLRHEGITLG